MATKTVKRYSTISIPSKNKWWLALELGDGSKPDGLQVSSAADLAALCDILSHSRAATYDADTGTLQTGFNSVGESAGGARE